MVPSAFAWPGGKRALTPVLLEVLPEHSTYIEVFAGSAKLLFAKPPSRYEIINDLNGEVTNFFRVAKHRTAELAERLELECIHAGRFRELRAEQSACELDRALRFTYLVWYSFGAKGEHFAQGNAAGKSTRRPLTRVRDLLASVAARLAAVQIEQQDFATILRRYDSSNSFFYLDPPYVEFADLTRYSPLTEERREELFGLLARLKGKFLLSFDDHPEIRRRARQHKFVTRSELVRYSLAAKGSARRKAPELLIANFAICRGSIARTGETVPLDTVLPGPSSRKPLVT